MEIGLFVLRAVIGLTFAAHGAQKLFGAFGGGDLDGTASTFERLGLRPARLHATVAASAEFFGGLLLAAGLFTTPDAAVLIAVMCVAVIKVHGRNGFFSSNGGFEFNLVMAAGLFALAALGAGTWSLDAAGGIALSGTGWALGALGLGIAGGVAAVAAARAYSDSRGASRHDRGLHSPA